MIISFYLFLTWFTVGILFTLSKRLPRQQLVFVFLFADFLSTNIGYLLSDPFGFYLMAKEPSRYVSFSLYQSLIFPAVLTLLINAFFLSSLRKTTVVLISVGVFLPLDFLARELNLFTYTGIWHLPALVGYRLLLLVLSTLAVKGFERMCSP